MMVSVQIRVEVTDMKNPERRDSAVVQLRVRRDRYSPEFQGVMEADLDVNHPVNTSSFLSIQATDRDKVVSDVCNM